MQTVSYKQQQSWIKSSLADSIFILSPPFFALLIVMLFPAEFKNSDAMPVQYWVILIVLIDVAHVYGTLYRTYFNPTEFERRHPLFIAIPIACYIAGVMLYVYDGLIFWRALAYLAVFHFVRQQYGFMRIYSRKEPKNRLFGYIDTAAIYMATIYPLLYWHFAGTHKNFDWFVSGDFLLQSSSTVLAAARWVYEFTIVAYVVKECWLLIREKRFNLPKNVLVAGTFLSWYFGIIYYNGDMAFTTLNVVSHGIPYMGLVWFTERKRYATVNERKSKLLRLIFEKRIGVLCFIALVIFFAYTEEGLWDGLVWKEHPGVFRMFAVLPSINQNLLLALLVPLLSLPQSTHYVLDGFIWKVNKPASI
jgi:hypothetical protein